MDGKKFRRSLIVTSILFFIAAAALMIVYRSAKDRTRLSVFPITNSSKDDSLSWRAWIVADQANEYLRKTITGDTLVYSMEWIWEAIDTDSINDTEYLKRYAARIGLDYLMVVQMDFGCDSCSTGWELIAPKSNQVFHNGREPNHSDSYVPIGQRLGARFAEMLGRKHSPNAMPASPKAEAILKWQALAGRAFASRKFDMAVALAEKALAIDSTNVRTRDLLARSYLENGIQLELKGKPGDLSKLIALKICERTISGFDSTDPEAHRILGKYYILRKMWPLAENHLQKARASDPNNARIYFDYSHLHQSRIKKIGFRNEEAVLRHAIYLDPCYEEARLKLADYLYFNKWPGRADKVVQELLAIHPRSIEGLLLLGKMAVGQADFDRIVATYNHILEIDPKNVEAYYNLGVFYFNAGDVQNAERFFVRAVEVGNSLDAHLYLGHIYQSKGQIDKAIEEYRLRIRNNRGPDDTFADEARRRLFEITKPDTSMLKLHGFR
jgi:tetratricopeptide (TPR) repeat protein